RSTGCLRPETVILAAAQASPIWRPRPLRCSTANWRRWSLKKFKTAGDCDIRERQDEEDSQTRKNGLMGTNLWCKVRNRKHVRHPTHKGASQHPFGVLTDRIGS